MYISYKNNMMNNIRLVVKYKKDGSTFVNFESAYKKHVDWEKFSDDDYEEMLKSALLAIEEWRQQFVINRSYSFE